ncbi:M23 family metallopeptidase [Streptomyces gobiensis]|uniref:M23 family metallopeptidase n=1 Tax=Streptomyces gobiensis TaxID=2875706 RepID=UPI001E4BCAB0|nr:M23 family metallopeptidase [Streptomyces gobiensis]UGY91559.1 M23 family metallopeptidase [Streptomyces gobiensis]
MCTQGGDWQGTLPRRGILLRGGALAALGLLPALGCAHRASAGSGELDEPLGGPPVWTRPLSDKYPVSAAYGIKGKWLAGHHTGIDFAVPAGTPVYAVSSGTVDIARYYSEYGYAVMLRMDDGHFVLSAHLSKISVKKAAKVQARTLLGETGASGRTTGPHLHFEVRTKRDYGSDIDPVSYLASKGVQLL